MAKMNEMERLELKGAIARIAEHVLAIDTVMKPSLKERVDALGDEPTQEALRSMYDQYLEELAEEYCKRMESDGKDE